MGNLDGASKSGTCISINDFLRIEVFGESGGSKDDVGNPATTPQILSYLILNGTKAQVESWSPWMDFKANHPNYAFGYTGISPYDPDKNKEFYSIYYLNEYSMGTWDHGGRKGDVLVSRYDNYKQEYVIDFVTGNIEGQYFIVSEDTPTA